MSFTKDTYTKGETVDEQGIESLNLIVRVLSAYFPFLDKFGGLFRGSLFVSLKLILQILVAQSLRGKRKILMKLKNASVKSNSCIHVKNATKISVNLSRQRADNVLQGLNSSRRVTLFLPSLPSLFTFVQCQE